jgi:heat shock protein HslJ
MQTQLNDGAVTTPAKADGFKLLLGADGSASTTTDCNTFRGTYSVEENRITITLPISTRMACPATAQEQQYIQWLTSVQSYLFAEGNLVLELPFDSGGMMFAPAP